MIDYADRKKLELCLQQIEAKLNWGKAKNWHHGMFVELSGLIQQQTGVLLSQTTLKRVWGRVAYHSAPSMTTLNALAQFAGYAHWREFSLATPGPSSRLVGTKQITRWLYLVPVALILGIGLTVLFSMISPAKEGQGIWDASKISFASRPIAEGLPNSVVFDFDLAGYAPDKIRIQQYWDPTKTIQLQPGQKQATGIYYYPGHFRAKLLFDEQVIKEHSLFIRSYGWMATLNYEPVPKYISGQEILQDQLRFSAELQKEVAQSEKPLQSTFHYVDDLGPISGDNFKLATTIQNTYQDKWAVCQKTKLIILGTQGALVIPFSIPGCISDLGCMLNDVYLSGKEHDLSALATNFSTPKNISLQVKDQLVLVSIDGQPVFQHRYKKSIGQLVGLRYRFEGMGEVHHLELRDLDGKLIEPISF